MRKLTGMLLAGALALTTLTSSAFADATKGQKLYLKKMKSGVGMNGSKFAALHSQDEWEELFANDGAEFIKTFSEKHSKLKKLLSSDKFKKKYMKHIKDFAIKYANDSGNVPSC
jgi:Spy/CpxP family protein refolding chaperone